MATVSDLIKGSMRLIGAIAAGETPTSTESADALSALNDMLGSWSTDGFLIFDETRETQTLTASQGAYTIGSGGDFDTARPLEILEAGVIPAGQTEELPIKIVNQQEWAKIITKSTQSAEPFFLYYDTEYTSGLGKVNLWPVPSAAATLVMYSRKPLASFSAISDTITLPPGFERALRYNLALELAPEYGRPIDPRVQMVASEALSGVRRTLTKSVLMSNDAAGLDGQDKYNLLTGFYT